MTDMATLERKSTDAAQRQPVSARVKDDMTMLKAAARLTRDLNAPDSRIYWADLIGQEAIEELRHRLQALVVALGDPPRNAGA